MEENASNALTIAGGVLLGIILVSLAVAIFSSTAEFARNYEETIATTEKDSFNNKFEVYARDDVTIQDIISVTNLAKETNQKNSVTDTKTDPYAIQIILIDDSGKINLEKKTDDELIDILEDTNDSYNFKKKNEKEVIVQKYKGEIVYSDLTGKVRVMTFTKN